MASTTSSAWAAVRNPPLGAAAGGTAPSAPVHRERSSAGSRCTVPRGPNALTRVASSPSARRTSARDVPDVRMPTDSSAAVMTWACAPHMARTISAGLPFSEGAASQCRSIRLAQTWAQENSGPEEAFTAERPGSGRTLA